MNRGPRFFSAAGALLAALALGGCQSENEESTSAPSAEMTAAASQVDTSVWPSAQEVREHMKTAFEAELQSFQKASHHRLGGDNDWTVSVFFAGVSAAWQTTGDKDYRDALVQWGDSVRWQPGRRIRHADDWCCGQAFLEVYLREGGPERIAGIKSRVDDFLVDPQPGFKDWWWCDALFMAPPVFTRLAQATDDAHYRTALQPLFWDVFEALWSRQDKLFYQRAQYLDSRTFWARGNGWVLAGLARIMQYLPEDDKTRSGYAALFKKMAARVVELQGADGAWRCDLLHPKKFPRPESSATALFAYGLAWGINHGLLSREDYGPAVIKAWAALKRAQLSNGQIGYVQPEGHEPDNFSARDTGPYGGGAFLLLGSELLIAAEAGTGTS